MSTGIANELASFHQFLGERLSENSKLSPEEALDLWRADHSEDYDDTVAAIEEALDEIRAGIPGIPAEQFDREFRRRHGLDMAE